MKATSDFDQSMKRMALIAIATWATVGSIVLQSPVLLVYIALHLSVTGVFLFFFLRKEAEARETKSLQLHHTEPITEQSSERKMAG